MAMLFSELKRKEVISLRTCNRIGFVVDIELDPCNGCIKRLIISNKCKWLPSFTSDCDCYICFKDIKQIGDDIIIVDV